MEDQRRKLTGGSAPKGSKDQESAHESAQKNHEPKSKNWWWLCDVAYILFLLAFWYKIEQRIAQTGESWVLNFLFNGLASVVSFVVPVIAAIVGPMPEEKQKEYGQKVRRPDGMNFWKHSWILFKETVIYSFKYNTVFVILVRLVLFLYIPAFAAKNGLAYRGLSYLSDGVTPAAIVSEEPSLPVSETFPIIVEESAPVQETEAAETDPPPEASEKKLRPLEERLVLQCEMPYTVSEEDYDLIFFRSGKYAITDWSNKDDVRMKVESFVQDQYMLRRNQGPDKNKENAQDYLDNVAAASDNESNMSNKEKPTSIELRGVIDTRVAAYDYIPFYELAKRIRESFCMWGDAIRWQNGIQDDAAILFMKSIFYGFQTLQYDVDEAKHRSDLNTLSERYEKLAHSLDEGSIEREQAFELSEAFEILSAKLS